MARLVNRRRSAKKSLRKSVKHTKRNNRKTRMSHKKHTRKQRGGETPEERVTRKCMNANETTITKCIENRIKQGFSDAYVHCSATCKPGGDKYIETKTRLAERKRERDQAKNLRENTE